MLANGMQHVPTASNLWSVVAVASASALVLVAPSQSEKQSMHTAKPSGSLKKRLHHPAGRLLETGHPQSSERVGQQPDCNLIADSYQAKPCDAWQRHLPRPGGTHSNSSTQLATLARSIFRSLVMKRSAAPTTGDHRMGGSALGSVRAAGRADHR